MTLSAAPRITRALAAATRTDLDRPEALHAVDDILRRQLAPVDRRLVVPADTFAQLEDVGGLIRLGPGLGQVTFEREGARHDAGARCGLSSRLWLKV